MTTCTTQNTITSADIAGLNADIDTISEVVESTDNTATTKNGRTIDTLTGRLLKLGYMAPVPYEAGIVFSETDNTKTIERDGIIYAPYPGSLPFTTSGTWTGDDDAHFYPIQGQLTVNTVSDLRAVTPGSAAHIQVLGHTSIGDGGGGLYYQVTGAPGAFVDDDGITVLPSGGDGSIAWMRRNDGLVPVEVFGAFGDGVTDSTAQLNTAFSSGVGLTVAKSDAKFIISLPVYVRENTTFDGNNCWIESVNTDESTESSVLMVGNFIFHYCNRAEWVWDTAAPTVSGTTDIVVNSGGTYAVGDVVLIRSNVGSLLGLYESSNQWSYLSLNRVRYVDGTTVGLEFPVLMDIAEPYISQANGQNVFDTETAEQVYMCTDTTIRNVNLKGMNCLSRGGMLNCNIQVNQMESTFGVFSINTACWSHVHVNNGTFYNKVVELASGGSGAVVTIDVASVIQSTETSENIANAIKLTEGCNNSAVDVEVLNLADKSPAAVMFAHSATTGIMRVGLLNWSPAVASRIFVITGKPADVDGDELTTTGITMQIDRAVLGAPISMIGLIGDLGIDMTDTKVSDCHCKLGQWIHSGQTAAQSWNVTGVDCIIEAEGTTGNEIRVFGSNNKVVGDMGPMSVYMLPTRADYGVDLSRAFFPQSKHVPANIRCITNQLSVTTVTQSEVLRLGPLSADAFSSVGAVVGPDAGNVAAMIQGRIAGFGFTETGQGGCIVAVNDFFGLAGEVNVPEGYNVDYSLEVEVTKQNIGYTIEYWGFVDGAVVSQGVLVRDQDPPTPTILFTARVLTEGQQCAVRSAHLRLTDMVHG